MSLIHPTQYQSLKASSDAYIASHPELEQGIQESIPPKVSLDVKLQRVKNKGSHSKLERLIDAAKHDLNLGDSTFQELLSSTGVIKSKRASALKSEISELEAELSHLDQAQLKISKAVSEAEKLLEKKKLIGQKIAEQRKSYEQEVDHVFDDYDLVCAAPYSKGLSTEQKGQLEQLLEIERQKALQVEPRNEGEEVREGETFEVLQGAFAASLMSSYTESEKLLTLETHVRYALFMEYVDFNSKEASSHGASYYQELSKIAHILGLEDLFTSFGAFECASKSGDRLKVKFESFDETIAFIENALSQNVFGLPEEMLTEAQNEVQDLVDYLDSFKDISKHKSIFSRQKAYKLSKGALKNTNLLATLQSSVRHIANRGVNKGASFDALPNFSSLDIVYDTHDNTFSQLGESAASLLQSKTPAMTQGNFIFQNQLGYMSLASRLQKFKERVDACDQAASEQRPIAHLTRTANDEETGVLFHGRFQPVSKPITEQVQRLSKLKNEFNLVEEQGKELLLNVLKDYELDGGKQRSTLESLLEEVEELSSKRSEESDKVSLKLLELHASEDELKHLHTLTEEHLTSHFESALKTVYSERFHELNDHVLACQLSFNELKKQEEVTLANLMKADPKKVGVLKSTREEAQLLGVSAAVKNAEVDKIEAEQALEDLTKTIKDGASQLAHLYVIYQEIVSEYKGIIQAIKMDAVEVEGSLEDLKNLMRQLSEDYQALAPELTKELQALVAQLKAELVARQALKAASLQQSLLRGYGALIDVERRYEEVIRDAEQELVDFSTSALAMGNRVVEPARLAYNKAQKKAFELEDTYTTLQAEIKELKTKLERVTSEKEKKDTAHTAKADHQVNLKKQKLALYANLPEEEIQQHKEEQFRLEVIQKATQLAIQRKEKELHQLEKDVESARALSIEAHDEWDRRESFVMKKVAHDKQGLEQLETSVKEQLEQFAQTAAYEVLGNEFTQRALTVAKTLAGSFQDIDMDALSAETKKKVLEHSEQDLQSVDNPQIIAWQVKEKRAEAFLQRLDMETEEPLYDSDLKGMVASSLYEELENALKLVLQKVLSEQVPAEGLKTLSEVVQAHRPLKEQPKLTESLINSFAGQLSHLKQLPDDDERRSQINELEALLGKVDSLKECTPMELLDESAIAHLVRQFREALTQAYGVEANLVDEKKDAVALELATLNQNFNELKALEAKYHFVLESPVRKMTAQERAETAQQRVEIQNEYKDRINQLNAWVEILEENLTEDLSSTQERVSATQRALASLNEDRQVIEQLLVLAKESNPVTKEHIFEQLSRKRAREKALETELLKDIAASKKASIQSELEALRPEIRNLLIKSKATALLEKAPLRGEELASHIEEKLATMDEAIELLHQDLRQVQATHLSIASRRKHSIFEKAKKDFESKRPDLFASAVVTAELIEFLKGQVKEEKQNLDRALDEFDAKIASKFNAEDHEAQLQRLKERIDQGRYIVEHQLDLLDRSSRVFLGQAIAQVEIAYASLHLLDLEIDLQKVQKKMVRADFMELFKQVSQDTSSIRAYLNVPFNAQRVDEGIDSGSDLSRASSVRIAPETVVNTGNVPSLRVSPVGTVDDEETDNEADLFGDSLGDLYELNRSRPPSRLDPIGPLEGEDSEDEDEVDFSRVSLPSTPIPSQASDQEEERSNTSTPAARRAGSEAAESAPRFQMYNVHSDPYFDGTMPQKKVQVRLKRVPRAEAFPEEEDLLGLH